MSRIDWEALPSLGQGLDRGVLYSPVRSVAWVEEPTDVDPDDPVTVDNSSFYDVQLSDPMYDDPPTQPHPYVAYSSEHVIGESSIRMYSENTSEIDGTYRFARLVQQFQNVATPIELRTWVRIKGARGHWGRFYMNLYLSGSESGSTYAAFIINSQTLYDPELDDMVTHYKFQADAPPGVTWDELHETTVTDEWYELIIQYQDDEAVFTVRDIEATVMGTITRSLGAVDGDLNAYMDFYAISLDPLNKMDIILDGIESNLVPEDPNAPPDYGYVIDFVDGVPWTGLISVEQEDTAEMKTDYYFDGIRHRVTHSLGDYKAKVSAFMYPKELDSYFEQSPRGLLGMTYRTHDGDSTKIHLIYNAKLLPFTRTHATKSATVSLESFDLQLVTKPYDTPGATPTAHLVIDVDSVRYPDALPWLEELLYGSEWQEPRLPSPREVVEIFEYFVVFRVTHNGDGTVTVEGPDEWIVDNGDGTYEISSPTLYPTGEDTYTMSSY